MTKQRELLKAVTQAFGPDDESVTFDAVTWASIHAAITELESQLAQCKEDAERFAYLIDYHSYHYSMQPDSPAEHGIEYQWQQGSYEERNMGIRGSIDAAIAARKEKA